MVIFAYLDTNVMDVIQDPVDEVHQIRHRGNSVTVKYTGGRDDVLDTSTGELRLGNIQYLENQIVSALSGNGTFNGDKFNPVIVPNRYDFNLFPTLFELERIAKSSVVINGILRLRSENDYNLPPEYQFFREQKVKLDAFVTAYARAINSSPLGKPIVEGFYEAIIEKNVRLLSLMENPERPEAGRNALNRNIYQREDFATAFGAHLFDQLQVAFRKPRYY